jgi:hypothetical protein
MAKKKTAEKAIEIPKPDFRIAKVTIVGESPLLVNKFSDKAKDKMDKKQQKKAVGAREARVPEEEFQAALYVIGKGKYGVPADAIKNAVVGACSFSSGVSKVVAKGSFQIIDSEGGLLPLTASKPVMDDRMVRVGPFGRKVAMTRYRARFDKWSTTFTFKYNAGVISAEQLINLIDVAGFHVGICDYRPACSGSFGMFHVKRG